MAKRKRLTPANPEFLGTPEGKPLPQTGLAAEPEVPEAAPETKSIPLGVAPVRARQPPIARVSGESSAVAALEELSAEMTRVRDEGRLVHELPLDDIETGHLVRDRLVAEEEELQVLIESLRRRGQQTPVEVVDRGADARPRYGLISGWRRMAALTRLRAEDPRFGHVLALVRRPKDSSEAYVAMVEENEIRVGLSYYERARIAVKSVEQGVYPDLKTALNTLFENVSRAKRSKIKSFTRLVATLDGALSFPAQIGERLGLELAKRLDEEPGLGERLRGRLAEAGPANAEEEQRILSAPAATLGAAPGTGKTPAPAKPKPEVARKGGVRVRYEAGKGRATLDGLDAATHAALLDWLEQR
ncbi:Nucleoid occlusion protein [Pseudooceanicola marinus]|uniref:Nucleoid occlusion protein n=1 Tax=Pseudooceanicola marinus TaxID=396013 RepID=A0A1X7AB68_9RHOB|nr:ParB N-terminal domain-containing protein [Pseudooceanicola marinus]SLN74444.1 Nucleoid occlusion protein [Pseudooceanicola marinus]